MLKDKELNIVYPEIKLLNIDCMEYMKDIPDNYFDLAIVDPPYGIKNDGKLLGRNVNLDKNKCEWNYKPINISED
jgi:site-specific DNA-methyltransferase (adenine-specific)